MNLTLPSNSSMDYYPDNTLASFKTHFESPLSLQEDHEVALSEIILPTTWSNVRDDDLIVVVPLRTKSALTEAKRAFSTKEKHDSQKTLRRIPDIEWSTVDKGMNLKALLESGDPLTEDEEHYRPATAKERAEQEETLWKLWEQEREANVVVRHNAGPLRYTQNDAARNRRFGRVSASGRRRKLRNTAKRLIDRVESKTRVRTLPPNIFPVPPIVTGSNADFVGHLNALLANELDGSNFLRTKKLFHYDRLTRRVTIKVPRHGCVLVSEHLAHVLGFGSRTYFTETSVGDFVMDVFGDVYSVYVYTDAVQDRRVGDMHAPLLRCVAVNRNGEREGGGIQAVGFPHLQYFPLKSSRLDGVGIYLRDRTGEPIPFMRGEVTVTLHLRPIER